MNNQTIGPYFINGTLNVCNILATWTVRVWLHIRLRMCYQHDDYSAHSTYLVKQILDYKFPNRWIGRNGIVAAAFTETHSNRFFLFVGKIETKNLQLYLWIWEIEFRAIATWLAFGNHRKIITIACYSFQTVRHQHFAALWTFTVTIITCKIEVRYDLNFSIFMWFQDHHYISERTFLPATRYNKKKKLSMILKSPWKKWR